MMSADALLTAWRSVFGSYTPQESDDKKEAAVLAELAQRLTGNYPFFHPAYAGQMLKPPARIAMEAYRLAMTINPNNHALDGGPPTSGMEKEVIAQFAEFFGFGKNALGHLTSGGTVANLEALWVARHLHPGKPVAFSKAAHYTHARMAEVLGMNTVEIPVDASGKMDVHWFEARAASIGTVVVTLGTTGLGLVEPLHEILPICKTNGVRVHIDAAYGGFFNLLAQSGGINPKPWEMLAQADSLVVDPHKHGLQPYGCGCILFRDASAGRFYKHDSPYTYFSSDELHLGEISLECSRAGAAAAALWATLQLFPLTATGLGAVLQQCRDAALSFAQKLPASGKYRLLLEPELDIVTYFPVSGKPSVSEISARSQAIFHRAMSDRNDPLFLSIYKLDAALLAAWHPDIVSDAPVVTVLRSVLMKPEHNAWIPELIRRLDLHYA
jgi:glutamate/tyrosine decarboxylase-like PLP-dependent enzyme